MSKRGNAETAIVLLVLAIAIIGAIFVFLPSNETSGMIPVPVQDQPGMYRLPMLECQSQCIGRPVGTPMYQYPRQRLGGTALQACLQKCYEGSAVSQYPEYPMTPTGGLITGAFAVACVKEYGGEIRGIAISGTRAFAGGRAYEMPKQACYTCSCLPQGITAVSQETAAKVCLDNCGGYITSELFGTC